MGTRADFYVGRGEQAEWLGSIAWDGYPDGIPESVLRATTPAEFTEQVAAFLSTREDKSLPEQGWPWPWDTSSTTDYAYAIDDGKVYASGFGGPWFVAAEERPDYEEDSCPGAVFPNMKGYKRRPLFGAHSGVIAVGLSADGKGMTIV